MPVETSAAKSTTVGTVESIDSSGNATITTLNLLDENGKPLTLTGGTAYTGTRADDMLGQLVSVSSTQKGRLSLTKLTGGGSKSALDVQKRTMGSVKLSDNVKLYEQVNASPLVEIELEDITRATVPAGQITYVHTDYAGNADIVVLNDATGDCYTYGMLKVETTRKPIYGRSGESRYGHGLEHHHPCGDRKCGEPEPRRRSAHLHELPGRKALWGSWKGPSGRMGPGRWGPPWS